MPQVVYTKEDHQKLLTRKVQEARVVGIWHIADCAMLAHAIHNLTTEEIEDAFLEGVKPVPTWRVLEIWRSRRWRIHRPSQRKLRQMEKAANREMREQIRTNAT